MIGEPPAPGGTVGTVGLITVGETGEVCARADSAVARGTTEAAVAAMPANKARLIGLFKLENRCFPFIIQKSRNRLLCCRGEETGRVSPFPHG